MRSSKDGLFCYLQKISQTGQAKEFKLLSLFASKPGRVFSRQNLLDAVWPSAFVDERTVDVHMLRLRKALAGTAAEDLIETVRGVGYRCRDV